MKRQRGFSLLYLAMFLPLLGITLSGFLWYQNQQLQELWARSQLAALQTLNDAVTSYRTVNNQALLDGTPIPGVSTPMAPTLTELVTQHFLDPGFATTNLYQGSYRVLLQKAPAGCSGSSCHLATLTYLTTPITDPQHNPDFGLLGTVAKEGGADVAFSGPANSATLYGLDGKWSVPNPQGPQAGILAIRGGYGAVGKAGLYSRDGALTMAGALDAGAHNLNNAGNAASTLLSSPVVSAQEMGTSGTLTTGRLLLPGTGTLKLGGSLVNSAGGNTVLQQNGQLTLTGPAGAAPLSVGTVQTQNTLSVSGTLSAQTLSTGGALSLSGSARASGAVTATGTVSGGSAVQGAACNASGALSARLVDGGTLVCRNGLWTLVKGCFAKNDFQTSSCPAGQVGGQLWKRAFTCTSASDTGTWSNWALVSDVCQTKSAVNWTSGVTDLNWGLAADAADAAIQNRDFMIEAQRCGLNWAFDSSSDTCYRYDHRYRISSTVTKNTTWVQVADSWFDPAHIYVFNTEPGAAVMVNKVYSGAYRSYGCEWVSVNYTYHWNGSAFVIDSTGNATIFGYSSDSNCWGGN